MDKLLNIIEMVGGMYVLKPDLLKSALTLAENCDNIALISIVGPKSHGKTFFINCLINYMNSQHKDKWPHSEDALIQMDLRQQSYGDNINPVIKLTSSPFIITDQIENQVIRTAVFLMDSDFVFDNEMSSQQVQDIIALFLLTSSTVIYNHKRYLPPQEFLRLETISYRISYSDNSLESLKNILFLIRDWNPETRNNEFSYGLYEGSKYIKNFIKNMYLDESYNDLNCFLMSAPILNSQTEFIKLYDLNKQFLLDFKSLVDFKLINVEEMLKKRNPNTNGYMKACELFELFENCVEKLNQNIDNNLLVDNLSTEIENLKIHNRPRDETDLCKNETDLEIQASGCVFVNGLNPTTGSHSNDSNLKLDKLETFEEKDLNQTEKSNSPNIDFIDSTYDDDIISCSSVSDSDRKEWSTNFQGDESIVILDANLEDFMSDDENGITSSSEMQDINYLRFHVNTNEASNTQITENKFETIEMSSHQSIKNNNLMSELNKNNLMDYSVLGIEESERSRLWECQSLPKSCQISQHFESKLHNTGNGKYNKEFYGSRFIARGNYGIVCEVMDKKNNKTFAIKKIPINKMSKERALKEAEILSKLNCNFIVRLESIWIEDNYLKVDEFENAINTRNNFHGLFIKSKPLLLHIQMEFCLMTLKKGIKTLNKELNQKTSQVMTTFGYSIASELFIEILLGIDYLHKQDVIHRDLKPSNILITDGKNGNFIKIADFGLATIHEFEGQSHTKYKGTIRYAAPEVMKTRKYDKKADIYSLGVIFLELFNIDINTRIGKETKLENKYSAIFDVTEKMLSPITIRRPDSEKILTEKNSWALSLDEIENEIPTKYEAGKYSQDLKSFILSSLLFSNEQMTDSVSAIN